MKEYEKMLYNSLYEIIKNPSKKIRKQEFKALKKALKFYVKNHKAVNTILGVIEL